jgi:hypothetical protein
MKQRKRRQKGYELSSSEDEEVCLKKSSAPKKEGSILERVKEAEEEEEIHTPSKAKGTARIKETMADIEATIMASVVKKVGSRSVEEEEEEDELDDEEVPISVNSRKKHRTSGKRIEIGKEPSVVKKVGSRIVEDDEEEEPIPFSLRKKQMAPGKSVGDKQWSISEHVFKKSQDEQEIVEDSQPIASSAEPIVSVAKKAYLQVLTKRSLKSKRNWNPHSLHSQRYLLRFEENVWCFRGVEVSLRVCRRSSVLGWGWALGSRCCLGRYNRRVIEIL